MSNPQEKAKDLVWKYYHKLEHTISDEYSKVDWEIAKECAIIAVDEILDYLNKIMIPNPFGQYWQQVKKEIQQLL